MKSILLAPAFLLLLSAFAHADVDVSPKTVYFGSIPVGASSFASLSLRNISRNKISLSFSGCRGDFVVSDYSCPSLQAYGTCSVPLSYTPDREGPDNCQLNIIVNGRTIAAKVALSGRGVPR